VLLIGYLLNCSPEQYGCTKINHRYYDYPDNLWGSHAFILTKPQALYFIQKYTVDYVVNHQDEVFCSDWVYTKQGRKALLYPPLIIEEGDVLTDHLGQIMFHRDCKNFLYIPDIYTQ